MVLDGRVAALWGGGIGWPGFTAVTQAGGRFIGLNADEVAQASAPSTISSKPITVPAGTYPGQNEPVNSVGSWSYILARPTLADDIAYRARHARCTTATRRWSSGSLRRRETTPQNTAAAAPRPELIHPGVQKYLREIGAWLALSFLEACRAT